MPSPVHTTMLAGRAKAPPPTLFEQVLAIFAGGTVVTADNYTLDGVSGKVYALNDWLDPSHLFAQSTAANQCAIPTANSTLANALCLNFTRAQIYTSNRPKASWNYALSAHSAFIVFSTSTIVSYEIVFEAAGGSPNSFAYYLSTVPDFANHLIRSNAQSILIIPKPANDAGYIEAFNVEGASPARSLKRNGVAAITGAISGSLSPIDATAVIGARAGAAVPFGGKLRAMGIAPRALSAAEWTTIRSWIQADTGIAP